MADRIKGITIEIGGDTTGLDKALSGTNKEIRNTQSQLKDVERLLKLDPSNTELLKQKQKLLAEAIGETKGKLDALKDAERQAEDQFKQGKISEDQYNALKREIIATEQQLQKLEDQAGKSSVALQKIGQAGETVKEFGGKVTDLGQKMTAVTGAIAAVGTASVAAWNTIDEAYDTIAKGTGATGEALEDLQKSFDSVFSSIPTEAATAGSAIADINTRFGFTGEVLEDCTKKFIQFGEVNNTDVSTAIANVSRYMGDAGIESSKYGEVLDQLTAASQASGLGVDKLSESLTKYGAPMRALGFDTKESIAIFAGWEKAGVNTEIAFSGMKKAIGTWGKEGKDARKEFKKTLDEIAAAPDIAGATTKAIEVFGQKAGPDLADAIQGGRFAYEDFLSVVENSSGQLEQTFNDTLDPIDDVKVAMQGLTSQGAELGGALLETLAPMITALVEKIKELTTWFKGLDDSQKEMVVKIGLVVAAIGPLLIVIGQVATGIGGLMTLVSTLGPVIGALGAAGGPILLTVAAVGTLGAAFLLARDDAGEYYDKAVELTDQETENKRKVDELCGAYDLLNQRRQDSFESIDAETKYEKDLFTELQNITDENGNVKAGYEERAKYILGELSSALGTEIEMTGNQIQKYDELSSSIEDLILKKQANALLDANAEAYAEALKNRTDAFMAYYNAQKDVEEGTRKLEEAQRREASLQEDLNNLRESGIIHMLGLSNESAYLSANVRDAAETTKGYQDKLSELNQTLTDAETQYNEYNAVISSQDMLLEAMDNQELLADAVLMASNSFQTAETSTKASLERQVETYEEQYKAMQDAVNAGAPGVEQAQVDNIGKLLEMSRKELGKLSGVTEVAVIDMANVLELKKTLLAKTGERIGKSCTDGTSGGISNNISHVEIAAKSMADAIPDTVKKVLGIQSSSRVAHEIGVNFDADLSEGIEGGTNDVIGSADKMTSETANTVSMALQTPKFQTMGRQITSGLSGGILSGKSEVITSILRLCTETINTAREKLGIHSPSTEFAYIGQMSGDGFIEGWDSTTDEMQKTIVDSVGQAVAKTSEVFSGVETALLSLRNSSGETIEGIVKNTQEAQEALQKIQDGLENTISGQLDMFSAFDGKAKTTTDELLTNMQSQVDGTEQWAENLRILAERGVDQGLLQKMAEMGPKGAGYVTTFTQMTDEELQRANALFTQTMILPEASVASIMQSYQIAGSMAAQGFSGGMQENTGEAAEIATQMAENAAEAIRTALEIHSPSQVTMRAGQYFTEGFSQGITSVISQVTTAVSSVTAVATSALSTNLKTSQTTTQTYQTTMSSSWTTWAAGLASQLKTTLAEISTATDSNMSEVNTTIDTKMRSLSQNWAQRWKEIRDKHRETVEKIQELHEKTLSDMEELNRGKTEAMKEGAIQSMQELSRGVKQELDNLPAIVEEGFAPAISYITSLADKSAGWGDDMMSGYIRGMKRKMRDLERACEEAADIVSDYLHHTTPEKGPMKDDDTWMPDMMQSFAGGIRKNRNLLLDQMKALTKDMALTMPNAGTMVKQPVTLKNYNVLALDGKVIADNINEQLGILL